MTKLPVDDRLVKHLTNPLSIRAVPLGTLLGAAARRLGQELDDALREGGVGEVRSAHASVFQFIEPSGSRLSDLAQHAGMTKQAMGELVRHLEKQGLLTVSADPDDGRAKIATLSEAGWQALEIGVHVIEAYEERLARAIGQQSVEELRRLLDLIQAGIVDPTDTH